MKSPEALLLDRQLASKEHTEIKHEVTSEFSLQMASDAESVFMSWCPHGDLTDEIVVKSLIKDARNRKT